MDEWKRQSSNHQTCGNYTVASFGIGHKKWIFRAYNNKKMKFIGETYETAEEARQACKDDKNWEQATLACENDKRMNNGQTSTR